MKRTPLHVLCLTEIRLCISYIVMRPENRGDALLIASFEYTSGQGHFEDKSCDQNSS